jgi:hypothetical protein
MTDLLAGAPDPNACNVTGVRPECLDLTDMKSAQEEARERQNLESLGVLAGGIAHDFTICSEEHSLTPNSRR